MMRRLTPDELVALKAEAERCCAECGRKLPERGFCSETCLRVFAAETPYWEAMAAGNPRAELWLPPDTPTFRMLAAARYLKRMIAAIKAGDLVDGPDSVQ